MCDTAVPEGKINNRLGRVFYGMELRARAACMYVWLVVVGTTNSEGGQHKFQMWREKKTLGTVWRNIEKGRTTAIRPGEGTANKGVPTPPPPHVPRTSPTANRH